MGFLWSAGGPKEKVSKLNLKKKVESGGNFEYKVQRVRKARQKLDFLEYQKAFSHNSRLCKTNCTNCFCS